VTATVELIGIDGKRLVFKFEAHHGLEVITRGRHERFVTDREKFDARPEKRSPE
jgi:fluoroacetyl-CoA thioesterase